MNNLEGLMRPFSKVSWRVGSTNGDKSKGMALAYLDARDVMERLDEVVGPENWQDEYPFVGCCRIGIKTLPALVASDGNIVHNGEWVWKSNGAGETNVEGEKGQYSDAFKRAGVLWGIGRYLYDMPNVWVEIEPMGRSYRFTKKAKEELNARYTTWANKIGVTHRFKPGEKDEIINQVRECLQNGDDHGLKQIMNEYRGAEEQMKFHALFNTSERSAIKKLLGEG